jgi:hypothetical protein
MDEILSLFDSDFGLNNATINHLQKSCKHRARGYRTADLIMNKYDILSDLQYTLDDPIPIPIVNGVNNVDVSVSLTAFSKSTCTSNFLQIVHFYEPDVNFVRILHNPKKYIDLLKKFNAVIGPDFSQKIGYQPFVCFENSWWNKALSAYFQKEGIVVIPNVTWSTPASYSYAFSGLPKNSIIAINCTGIKSSSVSIYLWRKGYEQAIRILEPTLILRYGDVMPGEYTDISVYFENINLNNLRNGREWK